MERLLQNTRERVGEGEGEEDNGKGRGLWTDEKKVDENKPL